jgi:hypothetical protein
MKRLALIAVMLLAIPAAAPAYELLIDDGFETYGLGTIAWGPAGPNGESWGSWGVSPSVVADTTGGGMGQVLAFSGQLGGGDAAFCDQTVHPGFTVTDGTIEASVDLYISSDTGFANIVTGPYTRFTIDANFNNAGVHLRAWTNEAVGDWAVHDPNWGTNLAVVPVATWFNVKTVLDPLAGSVDIYMNDVLVGSGLPIIVPEANFVEGGYECLDTAYQGVDWLYVDNFKMEHMDPVIPEPSMIGLGALGLLALLRRKK